MQIATNTLIPASLNLDGRYSSFKTVFERFFTAAGRYAISGQTAGLKVDGDLENNSVDVSLAGAKIRFTLFSELRDGGSIYGRIVVSRISHTINGEHLVLGEFSIKTDGLTDITDDRDNDPFELEYAAQPIMLHFLLEALKAPITGK